MIHSEEVIESLLSGIRTQQRGQSLSDEAAESFGRSARISLRPFLDGLDREGKKIRGARGNRVEYILELIESVRGQKGLSVRGLCSLAGVSRSSYIALLGSRAPNPTLHTILRLAVALDFPIELEELETEEARSASNGEPGHHRSGNRTAWTSPDFELLNAQLERMERELQELEASLKRRHEALLRRDAVVTTASFGAATTAAALIPHLAKQGPRTAVEIAALGTGAIAVGQKSYAGTREGQLITAVGGGLVLGAGLYALSTALRSWRGNA